MTGFKYYERTRYILALIESKKTGRPKVLARRLNISERSVYRIIDELKITQDKTIAYSKKNNSYVFIEK